uniref:Uncharacterized protein n=1 Tax=Anser cygnoides TaxID=8845 RepID=A0A8B9DR58_ANSCY
SCFPCRQHHPLLIVARKYSHARVSTGYLIRGIVGDCVAFHLACLQSAGYIHAIWKKDRQRVAQIRRQSVNASEVYCKRARVFHNGSLSLCPAEWRDQGEYVAEVYDQDGLHLHQIFHLELKSKSEHAIHVR